MMYSEYSTNHVVIFVLQSVVLVHCDDECNFAQCKTIHLRKLVLPLSRVNKQVRKEFEDNLLRLHKLGKPLSYHLKLWTASDFNSTTLIRHAPLNKIRDCSISLVLDQASQDLDYLEVQKLLALLPNLRRFEVTLQDNREHFVASRGWPDGLRNIEWFVENAMGVLNDARKAGKSVTEAPFASLEEAEIDQ